MKAKFHCTFLFLPTNDELHQLDVFVGEEKVEVTSWDFLLEFSLALFIGCLLLPLQPLCPPLSSAIIMTWCKNTLDLGCTNFVCKYFNIKICFSLVFWSEFLSEVSQTISDHNSSMCAFKKDFSSSTDIKTRLKQQKFVSLGFPIFTFSLQNG